MRYLGKISDVKDLVTKEYVDSKVSGTTGTVTSVNGVEPDGAGNVALIGENIPYAAGSTSTVKSEIDDRQMDTKKLEAETAIADEDAFPFYDASEANNRKTLWSNIVAKLKSLFLPLTGGTMTGAITIQDANGAVVAQSPTGMDTGYRAKNTTTGKSMFFGVGAGGDNHGIYSDTAGKWIIYNDGTTTYVDNTIPATAGAVGTTNLANEAVTSAKIAGGAVGTRELATGAVKSVVIANKAVTAAKIGTDVTYSTIGLTSSQVRTIYVGTSAPSSSTGSNGDIYLTYS